MQFSVQGAFRLLQRIEAFILSAGIILIALLTIANVFTRTLFDTSIAATEELSQFLIILVTFVGLSYGASQGRHIRMTALYDQVPDGARRYLMMFIAATTSALMFVLAWYALVYVSVVKELGSFSPVLQVPLYIVYAAAPLGLTLAGIQYAFTTIRNIRSDEVYIAYDHKDEYTDEMEAAAQIPPDTAEDQEDQRSGAS
jgi:TRAP-type C4-dicarboxylate transport system permease small subunit